MAVPKIPDLLNSPYVTNSVFLIISIVIQFIPTFALIRVQWNAIGQMTDLLGKYSQKVREYNRSRSSVQQRDNKCPRNKTMENPADTMETLKFECGDKHVSLLFNLTNPAESITFKTIQWSGIIFCLVHAIVLCVLLAAVLKSDTSLKIWRLCTSYFKIITVVSLVVIVTKSAKQSILVDCWEEFIILNEIILVLTKACYQEEDEARKGGEGQQGVSNPHNLWISLNTCWLISLLVVEGITAFLSRLVRALSPENPGAETRAYKVFGVPVVAAVSGVHLFFLIWPIAAACWPKNKLLTGRLLAWWSWYLVVTAVGAVVFCLVVSVLNLIGMQDDSLKILQQFYVHERHESDGGNEEKIKESVIFIVAKFSVKFVFINGILLLLTKNFKHEPQEEERRGSGSTQGSGSLSKATSMKQNWGPLLRKFSELGQQRQSNDNILVSSGAKRAGGSGGATQGGFVQVFFSEEAVHGMINDNEVLV